MFQENTIIIFADGASKGNPGPGGWGTIVSWDGQVEELGGGEKHTTNNRMEMTAAHEALRFAARLPSSLDKKVVVHTDSSYVINGITKWVKGWKARGWKTAEKKDVLNRDLWEKLDEAAAHFKKTEWRYVSGHVGIAGNERADEIASDFALGKHVSLYRGKREDYGHDLESIAHDEEKQKVKSGASTRSKQKAYSYVSLVEGDVRVHKTWSECEARVAGRKARYKKALSAADEAIIISEFKGGR
ncbi:MAG TPA: ribonuclease HI [Candidatus Paceibacterota bacterium]